MNSITTPNPSSSLNSLNLQTPLQSLGQIFEPIKKQWESSSFDQLFQGANSDSENRSPSVEYAFSESDNHNSDAQASITNAGITSTPAQQQSEEKSDFERTRSVLSSAGSDELTAVITDGQSEGSLAGPQILRGYMSSAGESDDGSPAKAAEIHAQIPPTDATDVTTQAVVVGMEDERIRVWMRGNDFGMTKEQLIAKVRAELSWAGMALGTFLLNGEKIVGLK